MNESKPAKSDVFAEIARSAGGGAREPLVEPGPSELPERLLPFQFGGSNPFGVAPESTAADSFESFQGELRELRRNFAPFMSNQAPAMPSQRLRSPLQVFDWRVQTPEDRRDFIAVLRGEGSWESVRIPHYGEPLGVATTYYRTEVELSNEQMACGSLWLRFEGVDYKAKVFFNGTLVGTHEGFFAPFECEVTAQARSGSNQLVIQVENDAVCGGNSSYEGNDGLAGDKIYAATGPGFNSPGMGWHHCPPGMGIYQSVFVEGRPARYLSDLYVRPLPEENCAEAWIEVYSCAAEPSVVSFDLSVYGRNFEACVFEDRHYQPETRHRCGEGDGYSEALARADGTYEKRIPLRLQKGVNYFRVRFPMSDFRWWEPDQPWLYQLQVKLLDEDAQLIDTKETHFGMRSFEIDAQSEPKGQPQLNGAPLRLRGANTMGHEQQCVMREDWDQLRDDILIAKLANLNFLRLTQRPVHDEVYTYCDMLGMMTQTDLPTFGVLRRNQYAEALRQVDEMEVLVRKHPCNILVSYINEPLPNAGNQPHRHLDRKELDAFFAAATDITRNRNPERMVKPCDGEYDPPSTGIQDRHCYPLWYNGHGIDVGKLVKGYWQAGRSDWCHACGEFGAEGLDHEDLMRRRYPSEWLAVDDGAAWDPSRIPHAQTGRFGRFFYDPQSSLADWIRESQVHQAYATRLMTEAFRRDDRMVSFAIHLLIDAFPAGWMKSLVDCERRPKPAYFAYRHALSPLLATLRSDRTAFFTGETASLEVWISNDHPSPPEGIDLEYRLVSEKDEVLAIGRQPVAGKACGSVFQGFLRFEVPEVRERSVLRLSLQLSGPDGRVLHENDYPIEVFPRRSQAPRTPAYLVSGERESAEQLAEDFGCEATTLDRSELVLIDDWQMFQQDEAAILDRVRAGARLIFLDLPPGRYSLDGSSVEIAESAFNPLYFVSRKTNHRWVEGFRPHDFRNWYDPKLDRMAPLLESTFLASDFNSVLTAASMDAHGGWGMAHAVGERPCGEGRLVISQLKLAGRTGTNPTAQLFAEQLLAPEPALKGRGSAAEAIHAPANLEAGKG